MILWGVSLEGESKNCLNIFYFCEKINPDPKIYSLVFNKQKPNTAFRFFNKAQETQ